MQGLGGKTEEGVRAPEDIPLVEVSEASRLANDAFNRVKAEKIAEQAMSVNRAEEAAQYEGLGSEIVGKAIKQRERERSNRAAAAASRARVLTYQHELEARLNRVEAERNGFRREVTERGQVAKEGISGMAWRLAKVQGWVKRMETEDPEFMKSLGAQGEMESLLREEAEERTVFAEDERSAKRRRM